MKLAIQNILSKFSRIFAAKVSNDQNMEIAEAREKNIIQFEELLDVRYNQVVSKLEATIIIHDTTGYNGNICATGSTEYVRFFVDWGKGYENAGFTSVQVYDHTGKTYKSTLPQKYLVQLFFRPQNLMQSSEIKLKIRAILSWNELPPPIAAWTPVFGNICEACMQLRLSDALTGELPEENDFPKPLLFSYDY